MDFQLMRSLAHAFHPRERNLRRKGREELGKTSYWGQIIKEQTSSEKKIKKSKLI